MNLEEKQQRLLLAKRKRQGDIVSETENSTQEQKPRTSNVSIWTATIIMFICIAVSLCVGLCVGLQIISLETLLIFVAIFLPVIFFIGLLLRFILYFIKK